MSAWPNNENSTSPKVLFGALAGSRLEFLRWTTANIKLLLPPQAVSARCSLHRPDGVSGRERATDHLLLYLQNVRSIPLPRLLATWISLLHRADTGSNEMTVRKCLQCNYSPPRRIPMSQPSASGPLQQGRVFLHIAGTLEKICARHRIVRRQNLNSRNRPEKYDHNLAVRTGGMIAFLPMATLPASLVA